MKKRILVAATILLAANAFAQNLTKPEETEVWKPEVPVIAPAKQLGNAPSDAIVLFDSKNLDAWQSANKAGAKPEWTIDADGAMTVKPGTGDIRTRDSFGDIQLHIEWRSPIEPDSIKGQMRGNSGVFLQERYEVQVLNSYKNKTYANGQAGAIYKQTPPLVNACQPVGEWNVYDIVFIAPRFRANGSLEKAGHLTVFHNGVLIQNFTEIQGTTEYIGAPIIKIHGNAPIRLQDHSNKVSYRNIWLRKL